MEAGALYDQHVAAHYDTDLFGIFKLARQVSLEQIEQVAQLPDWEPTILDIGCGTGVLLEALRDKINAKALIGLDPSHAMLEVARRRGATRTVCATVLEAEDHIAPASVDLVCMHFVLSYVDPSAAIATIGRLLKPKGQLSLVTSTFESMPNLQRVGAPFISVEEQHQTKIPADEKSLTHLLEQHGFRLCDTAPLQRDLDFKNIEQFYQFAIRQGWLVQHAEKIERFRDNPSITASIFPVRDEFRGVALLAERC